QSDGTTTEYFASDGLGSVRQVMDEAGSPLLTQTFDPYGSLYARTGEGVTNFGFTGEYGDTNGLLYLRARYYAPSQGRFFQLDPSRLELNPYMYSMGNPILYTDPSGYCTLGIFGEDCPPENYQTVAQVLASIGYIDFWYAEFWGGFATELVNITALNVPGRSLEIYNIAYDALAGCDRTWPVVPTLDDYFGPRFQRGRWLGRVVALGLGLGEVTVGGAGATLSIAGTHFPLGLSALGAAPSLTITAHGAVVVGAVVA